MRKKRKYIILCMILSVWLTGCGSLYENNKNGYTEATSIEGICYDMPEDFLSKATAITSIADDVDYSTDTYLYKNGADVYILFDIENVIVSVQKGTNFDLKNASNKTQAIQNASLNNIWFTPMKKNLSYDDTSKDGVYKIIADVYADVSITPDLYGTFYGKFASIQKGDYEYSIFAGVPSDGNDKLSGEQKRVIEHIVKSFQIAEHDETSEYVVTGSADSAEDSDENVISTEAEEIPAAVNGEYSDIYHPLTIGQTGSLIAISNDGTKYESGCITIDELYTGDDAVDIIKEYYNSDATDEKYQSAPDGYSWHVIRYTVDKSPYDLYIDIQLKGMDGEKLVYRGVPASSRTYDIYTHMQSTEAGYGQLFCYYAVPNGCKEYLLECGTRRSSTSDTACYSITDY